MAMKKELGILVILVVLCSVLAVANPKSMSTINLQNTARLIGMFGIFSIGIGFVIISGGIELSVGSVLALLGIIMTYMLVTWNWPWPIVAVSMLAIGSCIGLFHGFMVTKARIQPFVVTLCGLLIYRGLARFISDDSTRGFGSQEGFEKFQRLANGNFLGIPAPFIIMVVFGILAWVVLHHSVYGRRLFVVGRNEEAARYSGINTRLVVAGAYVICGFLAGISAILFAFYTNAVSPSAHGNFYELFGIAASVLGGCSLRGGEGSVLGIVLGAALIQILQNLVNLLGVPSSLNFAVMGAVIILGVVADQIVKQRREARTS